MLLDKEKLLYDTVKISVELNQDSPDKTIFVYNVDISGNIEEEIKQAIIKKASQCPVRRTLSKIITFEEKHQS